MYLIRIVLPDQPGGLGAVASALGAAGADIVAVDVVERKPDGTAVDDFVVELPLGGRADTLVSACQSIEGVRVEWLSRYGAGGNLRGDLEAVEAMTERPRDATRLLVDLVPTVFRADWAMLVHRGEGPKEKRRREIPGGGLEARYATSGAPGLPAGEVSWFPVRRPVHVEVPPAWEAEGWRNIAAAAVPMDEPARPQALVLGRSGGPEILDSELARLAHLASLAMTIQAGSNV